MANKKKFPWKEDQSAEHNATEVLPSLAAAFFAQGRDLTPQAAPDGLHNFRIQAKSFRDTLELFRPCYDRRLEQLLKLLRDMQQILGEMNDLATTRRLLTDYGLEQSRPRLLDSLDTRIQEKVNQFFSVWKKTFAPVRKEYRWVNYLARRA